MLQVYDLGRKRTAYLENAFKVSENEPINDVSELQFSLPITDPKTARCHVLHYVRCDSGQLYRIVRPTRRRDASGVMSYLCEHVIATLADSVMRGAHVVGNLGVYTRDAINYVLAQQRVTNWVLDECDFTRQFEYAWENENCLNALWSIPNRFTEPYIWKFDTSVYPWKISLKRINADAAPEYFVRGGKNMLSATDERNAQGIVTRLYALGYGEGVNQLTIASVNGGVEYLQSPQGIIDEYGIIERIWVDRRFEDAQSLKDRCAALLHELQVPRRSCKVDVADIYQSSHDERDKIENGRIVMLVDEDPAESVKTYITSIKRNYDDGGVQITIANKPTDIASSLADLADRQRIEQVYSQGATQLYAQSIQANASASKGAVMNFYIPSEMRIVNAVKVKISLGRFRSYSQATGGGGASTATSEAGGGSTATSSSGGGTSTSTQSGGGTSTSTQSGGGTATSTNSGGGTSTSSDSSSATTTNSAGSYSGSLKTGGASTQDYSGFFAQTGVTEGHTHGSKNHWHALSISIGNHSHGMSHTHSFSVPSHSHGFSVPAHSHSFSVPAHSHSFSVPAHQHSVTIPSHTHSTKLPDHTHNITQGIFEFGSPSSAEIYVNGALKASIGSSGELDITQFLAGSNNQIPRGSWMKIEVRPNDLAYVTIDMFVQGFVQSRGGLTY